MTAGKVLIAVKEKLSSAVLQEYFKKSHFPPDIASDGKTLLKLIDKKDYLLAFIDIKFPEFHFSELLDTLRKKKETVPVIIVAPKSRLRNALEAVGLGAFDYLIKPISPEMIKVAVNRALLFRNLKLENALLHQELKEHHGTEQSLFSPAKDNPLSKSDLKLITSLKSGSLERIVHLKLEDFIRKLGPGKMDGLYDLVLERVERPLIKLVLERTRGNQIKASEILGINRNTLRRKIQQLNISNKK
ncbi:MAG: response regulator [Deltaproteobacteria bacterium]|nr:MAG: response regulator [Deltaproteobacteria bacterium]